MLHWDSKPPIFPHPCCPRCNNWPKTHHPCPLSNSWLFGVIWDMIGTPRGVWCHFGNFEFYAHNWLPKPQKNPMLYYIPDNNKFHGYIVQNYLVPVHIVCVICLSFDGFLSVLHQIWFLRFINTPIFFLDSILSHGIRACWIFFSCRSI